MVYFSVEIYTLQCSKTTSCRGLPKVVERLIVLAREVSSLLLTLTFEPFFWSFSVLTFLTKCSQSFFFTSSVSKKILYFAICSYVYYLYSRSKLISASYQIIFLEFSNSFIITYLQATSIS